MGSKTEVLCLGLAMNGLLLILHCSAEGLAPGTGQDCQVTDKVSEMKLSLQEKYVRVYWSLDNPSGNVTGFKVAWHDRNGDQNMMYVKDVHEATTTSLVPCRNYTVKVTPVNKEYNPLGVMGEKSFESLKDESLVLTHLEAVGATRRAVHLKWQRPVTDCQIISYTIDFYGVSNWGHDVTDQGTTTINDINEVNSASEIVIKNLLPWSLYNFSVSVATQARRGPTVSIVAHTDQEAPQPPVLLMTNSTSSSIGLKWRDPEPRNGASQYYTVSWRKDGHLAETTAVKTNDFTYTIPGLPPCMSYSLRVTTTNEAGEACSVEVKQVTKEADPPAPTLLCLLRRGNSENERETKNSNYTNSRINVFWKKPVTDCNILQYVLSWFSTRNNASSNTTRASLNYHTFGSDFAFPPMNETEVRYTSDKSRKRYTVWVSKPDTEYTVCAAAVVDGAGQGDSRCCTYRTESLQLSRQSDTHKQQGTEPIGRRHVSAIIVVVILTVVIIFSIIIMRRKATKNQFRVYQTGHKRRTGFC